MAKLVEAQEILKALGLPSAQQNEISALTLLALCGLRPVDDWRQARRRSVTVTKGIMHFHRAGVWPAIRSQHPRDISSPGAASVCAGALG